MMVDQIGDQGPAYTFRKRGIFYFSRRVPTGLESKYRSKRIVLTLRTRCPKVALKRSRTISNRLETYWDHLRWREPGEVPEAKFLRSEDGLAHEPMLDLGEATKLYLRVKGRGKTELHQRTTERAIGYALACLGNKPISDYQKSDAVSLREYLFKRKLAVSSVRRLIAVVRAVINFAILEKGYETKNAFNGVYISSADNQNKRETIPLAVVHQIQRACVQSDDEKRWLVALISDTGIRLSEGAGLLVKDFHLNEKIPYVRIRPHPWRKLKTASSERDVPLTGLALWAAQKIVKHRRRFAFPDYCDDKTCKGNSASATLNKWMFGLVGKPYVIHGFRHSLRDRLRKLECPTDVVDQIGGWATNGVGQSYGDGYPLTVTSKWMTLMTNENSV